MFLKSRLTIIAKYNFLFLTLVIFSVWWQSSCAYRLASLKGYHGHLNPNMRCPGKNVENIWRFCKNGGYIVNPDPKNCDDRYVCYVGLNEPCHRGDICADNALCTSCGLCQKCDSVENCSEFKLCPNIIGFNTVNYKKRFLQNHSANKFLLQQD